MAGDTLSRLGRQQLRCSNKRQHRVQQDAQLHMEQSRDLKLRQISRGQNEIQQRIQQRLPPVRPVRLRSSSNTEVEEEGSIADSVAPSEALDQIGDLPLQTELRRNRRDTRHAWSNPSLSAKDTAGLQSLPDLTGRRVSKPFVDPVRRSSEASDYNITVLSAADLHGARRTSRQMSLRRPSGVPELREQRRRSTLHGMWRTDAVLRRLSVLGSGDDQQVRRRKHESLHCAQLHDADYEWVSAEQVFEDARSLHMPPMLLPPVDARRQHLITWHGASRPTPIARPISDLQWFELRRCRYIRPGLRKFSESSDGEQHELN